MNAANPEQAHRSGWLPASACNLEAMLGWHVSVYRQASGRDRPASLESPSGDRIAVWQTGLNGLDWIEELVDQSQMILVGGNGYPVRFTGQAAVILPVLVGGPPLARQTWVSDPDDVLTDKWEGKTVIDEPISQACNSAEWLIIEAWDES